MTTVEFLAAIALLITALLWFVGWLDTHDRQLDQDHQTWLEDNLARVLPYDVDGDNWLEVSHFLAWVEGLPETDEPEMVA